MHRLWKSDGPETYALFYKTDWPQTHINNMVSDAKELRKLSHIYYDNLSEIVDIYHLL